MKKALRVMTVLSVVLASLSFACLAGEIAGELSENVAWSIKDGVLTVSGEGEMPNWSTKDASPFTEKANLIEEIVIEDGIENIGEYAFAQCRSLTSVEIAQSVTEIGEGAFYSCSDLEEIYLPESVEEIWANAFMNCNSLKSINIPEGVEYIPERLFHGCTDLVEVTLPDSLETIAEEAFYKCSSLSEIQLPDGLRDIERSAFAGCSSIESIEIPKGVKLDLYAFSKCTSLKTAYFEEGTNRIGGKKCFSGCENLLAVFIPESVEDFADDILELCRNASIYGEYGSCAEQYADENDIPFASVDEYEEGKIIKREPVHIKEKRDIFGDINGDGEVTNRDAAALMQYLAGWSNEEIIVPDDADIKYDINGDGKLTNRDAARIMQYVAGWDVEF